jgi:mannose-6-phosphate isomerase class I
MLFIMNINKPYIIIPKFIPQATWGGEYIVNTKKWNKLSFLNGLRIGQSYELFSGTKLFISSDNTESVKYIPEIGYSDRPEILNNLFPLVKDLDYINLADLIDSNPEKVLGPKVLQKFGKMHLLIKFTQAKGNSFQLHRKPGPDESKWQPKAESWYYFEDGKLTFGIATNKSVTDYQKTCREIEIKMQELSDLVINHKITLVKAESEAKTFINKLNPWQYVNVMDVAKDTVLDLSAGGLHHSWEEDPKKYPLGNILYEVQEDVMDPVSTLRSFDQGKFKTDGTVRSLDIDDYFKYLDTDPERNNPQKTIKTAVGKEIFRTSNYAMDKLEINGKMTDSTQQSYCHLFVKNGDVEVITTDGYAKLSQGSSCFLPYLLGDYEIRSNSAKAIILKTFINI